MIIKRETEDNQLLDPQESRPNAFSANGMRRIREGDEQKRPEKRDELMITRETEDNKVLKPQDSRPNAFTVNDMGNIREREEQKSGMT